MKLAMVFPGQGSQSVGMMNAYGEAAIVRATIDLSSKLGMSVAAEGVETARELEMLASLGCDEAQGLVEVTSGVTATTQVVATRFDNLKEGRSITIQGLDTAPNEYVFLRDKATPRRAQACRVAKDGAALWPLTETTPTTIPTVAQASATGMATAYGAGAGDVAIGTRAPAAASGPGPAAGSWPRSRRSWARRPGSGGGCPP